MYRWNFENEFAYVFKIASSVKRLMIFSSYFDKKKHRQVILDETKF